MIKNAKQSIQDLTISDLNDVISIAHIRHSGGSRNPWDEFNRLDTSLRWYDVRRFSPNRFAHLRFGYQVIINFFEHLLYLIIKFTPFNLL
jgi:hypothetical protein